MNKVESIDDFKWEPLVMDEGFDLCADEMAFYMEAIKQRESTSTASDRSDSPESGYGTARRAPRRPELRTENDSSRQRREVNRGQLREAELLAIRDLEGRTRNEHYLLTPPRIAWHLLEFLSTSYTGSRHKSSRSAAPLFMVDNGRVVVDEHYVSAELPTFSPSLLTNLASPLLTSHKQLAELIEFTDNQRTLTDAPLFMKVWVLFFDDFILEYFDEVIRLQQKIKCPSSVWVLTRKLREQIGLLHRIILPVSAAREWKWSEVEFAWSNFFLVTGDAAILTPAEMSLACRLQQVLIPTLLSTLDSIYSTCRVPPMVEQHFVLYYRPSSPDMLLTRLRQDSHVSLLWDDKLLLDVLRGCQLRHLIGPLSVVEPLFTNAFKNYIMTDELVGDTSRHISFHVLQRAFSDVAKQMTSELSNRLFVSIMDAQLLSVLRDIKSVTIGDSATSIAHVLFRDPGRRQESVGLAVMLRDAISTGVSRVDYWRWAEGGGFIGSLTCKPPAPLSSILCPSLFTAVVGCLEFWLKIFRMNEVLIRVLSEGDSSAYSKMWAARDPSTWRRFRSIVNDLYKVVEIIRRLFINKVSAVFDQSISQLAEVNNFDDAEKTIKSLEANLAQLVDRKGLVRIRDILETIDIYSALADDFLLKSLGGSIPDEQLTTWRVETNRTYEYLHGLGKRLPADNIFHLLYLEMGFRSCKRRETRTKEEEIEQ